MEPVKDKVSPFSVTGRLSTSHPSFAELEDWEVKFFRKFFATSERTKLMNMDFSAIERRVLASMGVFDE